MKRFLNPATVVCAVAALTVTACAPGTESAQDPGQSSPSVVEETPGEEASEAPESAELPTPAAQVGDCFDTDRNFEFTNVGDPVPCTPGSYTQETVAVLDLPSDLPISYPERQQLLDNFDAGETRTDEQEEQRKAFDEALSPLHEECRSIVRDIVMPGAEADAQSLFSHDLTGPNGEQWASGERWARCNITRMVRQLNSSDTELLSLPRKLERTGFTAANKACYSGPLKDARWRSCDDPQFEDNAWMTVLSFPASDISAQAPGKQKKSAAAVDKACAEASEKYVKTNQRDYLVEQDGYNSLWRKPTNENLAQGWGSAQVYCAIPSWAYNGG